MDLGRRLLQRRQAGGSGLGLYIRPSILHRVGARIPRGVADAWTAGEFTGILHRLQRAGYRQPLDLQVNSGTLAAVPEWLTYGFAPVVWSAGGDLIDRSTYRTAQGVLSGSVITWSAQGDATGSDGIACRITLTGTAEIGANSIRVPYSGDTCLGKVSGVEILNKK